MSQQRISPLRVLTKGTGLSKKVLFGSRSLVQAACLAEFEKRIPLLCQIADGTLAVQKEVVTQKGDVVVITEEPSIRDRMDAVTTLGRFAGAMPKAQDLNGEDDGGADAAELAGRATQAALGALAHIAARLAGGHQGTNQLALEGEVQPSNSAG